MQTIETQRAIDTLTNQQTVTVRHFYYPQIKETTGTVHKGMTSCGKDYFYISPLGDSHPGASITKTEIIEILNF